jgi:hypothetical protein
MQQQLQLQLRYIPKPGVDVVVREEERAELNCSRNMAVSNKKPTAQLGAA